MPDGLVSGRIWSRWKDLLRVSQQVAQCMAHHGTTEPSSTFWLRRSGHGNGGRLPSGGCISMVLCCPLQVLCYDPRTRLTSRFGSDLIDAACLNCLPQDLPVQFSCKCLSAWNSLLTHLCVLLITAVACTCATRCHEIAAAAASAGLGKEQVTLPASHPNAP